MNVPTRIRQPRKSFIAPLFVAGLVAFWVTSAKALPEDDVRAAFDQFVIAQNAHDAAAVRELLLDSPSFLWVTRGAPIWGATQPSSASRRSIKEPGNCRPTPPT